MINTLYKWAFIAGKPYLNHVMKKRLAKGKEDAARIHERHGQPKMERPAGPLLWCHGASVGESLSLLILIEELLKTYPDLNIMMTTGTVTSASLMEKRLPKGAFHQYMPIDHPAYVANFLDHWLPNMVIWLESDLWPNMLAEIKKRDIPAALVNARMSKPSFRKWKRFAGSIKNILSSFDLILAQNEGETDRYIGLGGNNVVNSGNLKYASKPLPVDEGQIFAFEQAIDDRTAWQISSTHAGEEEQAIEVHKGLSQDIPSLLTVIIPRHPERGPDIKLLVEEAGLNASLRSNKEEITKKTDIYIADTMGELGLFYRAVPIVCVGGSLIPWGGHNPIEPAQLDCEILYGPHMHNFETICEDFDYANASRPVKDWRELQDEIYHLIRDPVSGKKLSENARVLVMEKANVVQDIMNYLTPLLKRAEISGDTDHKDTGRHVQNA